MRAKSHRLFGYPKFLYALNAGRPRQRVSAGAGGKAAESAGLVFARGHQDDQAIGDQPDEQLLDRELPIS
jgi:hypothetical protein